jgi:hypothetical protein
MEPKPMKPKTPPSPPYGSLLDTLFLELAFPAVFFRKNHRFQKTTYASPSLSPREAGECATMTRREIVRLAELDGKCGYHETNKKEYRRLSLRLLRTLSKELGLERSAEIRYNPGGIAVSGDSTLHADRLYATLNLDGLGLGILVRTCRHRRDFKGGPNHWFSLQQLKAAGLEGLAEFARRILGSASPIEEERHGRTTA